MYHSTLGGVFQYPNDAGHAAEPFSKYFDYLSDWDELTDVSDFLARTMTGERGATFEMLLPLTLGLLLSMARSCMSYVGCLETKVCCFLFRSPRKGLEWWPILKG